MEENSTDELVENVNVNVSSDDDFQVAAYYDDYYSQVLSDLYSIQEKQDTIIENEQVIIACHQEHNTSFALISFFLGIIVCYLFIRDLFKL